VTRTALFFGSDAFGGDDIAFGVFDELEGRIPGVRMVKCSSSVEMLYHVGKGDLYIVDAVRGLGRVTLFENPRAFRKVKSATVHDLDVGTFLQVLEEAGKLKGVKIIGIPLGHDRKKAAEEVAMLLSP
jgi:hypothetical protein